MGPKGTLCGTTWASQCGTQWTKVAKFTWPHMGKTMWCAVVHVGWICDKNTVSRSGLTPLVTLWHGYA